METIRFFNLAKNRRVGIESTGYYGNSNNMNKVTVFLMSIVI